MPKKDACIVMRPLRIQQHLRGLLTYSFLHPTYMSTKGGALKGLSAQLGYKTLASIQTAITQLSLSMSRTTES